MSYKFRTVTGFHVLVGMANWNDKEVLADQVTK